MRRCNSRNNLSRSQTKIRHRWCLMDGEDNHSKPHGANSAFSDSGKIRTKFSQSLHSDEVKQTQKKESKSVDKLKQVLPSSNHSASPVSSLSCQSSRLPCCCVRVRALSASVCVCVLCTAERRSVSRPAATLRLELSVASRWKTPTAPMTHAGL